MIGVTAYELPTRCAARVLKRSARADNGKMRAANESYARKMNIIVILVLLLIRFLIMFLVGSSDCVLRRSNKGTEESY